MINRLRMAARISPFSCIGFNTLLSVFIAKKGNSNPLNILSLAFHTSSNPSTISRNCKFGFEGIKNLDDAVTLFDQMLLMKPLPPLSEFYKLFKIIVEMNHGSQVSVLLKRLSLFQNSRNPKYWYGFEGIKNIDDAVGLFDIMIQLDPVPTIYDYGQLLNIVVKMKHFSEAICMFKKLSLSGFPVDDVIMTTVMNCYCNLKEVKLGFAMLASMIKHGYAPDIVSITCLIKGFFIEGNAFKAVELFKRVIRDKLCEVNEITISTVLDGLSKSGHIVNAVKFLENLEKKGVELNVVVYTTVIDGLCKAGMVEDAMNLLFRMIDRCISPNGVTYTTFIHGLFKQNKLDFARYIFNDLSSKKIRPDKIAYTVLIQGLCQKGLFQDVKEMLEKMESVGRFPDSITYNIIIQGCLIHHDSIYSIDLFKEIIERDFQLDTRTFFMLIRHMKRCYGGDVQISHLIRKLISSDTTRLQIQGCNDDVMINSLIQKLISSDAMYLIN